MAEKQLPIPKLEELLKEHITIQEITDDSVVLIGSYSDNILKIIRECLEEIVPPFVPIIAKKVTAQHGMTPRQKLHAVLSICGFVIAEDSIPCGEMIELEYCRHTGAVTAIMHRGVRSSYMTLDCALHSPDFAEFEYKSKSKEDIRPIIKEIISWVQETKKVRRDRVEGFDDPNNTLAYEKYCSKSDCINRERF